MKTIVKIAVITLLAAGFLLASKPASQQSPETAGASTTITDFAQVVSDVQSGAQLIDVRTLEEFEAGHIDGASLLPLQDIERDIFPATSKTTKLYLYCRSGNRSAQAKQVLETAGYTNVVDLGAMSDVEALGGKVIR